MDPLEAILRQRQQRYEVWDNLTDRLAKIGEDRRRKMFTQAAMNAIPDDGPVGYEVYTNLINEYPSMDPQEAFNIVGGLAKAKTADRVKRVVRSLQETKEYEPDRKKSVAEDLYRKNADIWGDVAEILKHGQAQYVERNPERDLYKQDSMTGDETLVRPARKEQKEALLDKWQTHKAAHPEMTGDELIASFTQLTKTDTESDRNYEIYAQRLREQGKTPAPKDIWRAKATNPMEDYEAFANEDYGPKPEEPKKSGNPFMDKLRSAFGMGDDAEGDPLREQAIAELKRRGKDVTPETIRKAILILKATQ